MSLSPGTRLGPYEVTAQIGEGGMGQVYRARDTRLDRDVAIKILPDALASDPDRSARFEREAKTLASLSHPNVAGIYGVEGSALVMELVEGEDLSAHIARGPISVADAVAIARQIADALEAAHERGIVHRDLKPANIKVCDDGTVKVLDFGLAKALDTAAGRSGAGDRDLANSPTFTNRGTELGMILGTAAYMAPEQARGRPVDRRADIWAFGVVLYEMLSGRRAFQGDDVSITLANVLKEDVNRDALPAGTPANLRTLIARCLEKDPKKRLGWIGEARYALEQPMTSSAASVAVPEPGAVAGQPSRGSAWLPWTLATLASIAAVALLVAWSPWRETVVAADPRRLHVEIGADAPIESIGMSAAAILSPDGRTMVFVGVQAGQAALYVRKLDQLSAQKLEGTEGAFGPFFSPRGDWVGYFTPGQMKKVPVTGGASVPLAPAPNGRGAAWLDDDTIIFTPSPSPETTLMRLPAAGGTPTPLSKLSDGARSRRFPQALPGGTHLLVGEATEPQNWDSANILVVPISGGDGKVVVRGGYYPRFVPSRGNSRRGHLLYVSRHVIWAAPFDLDRLDVTGEAFQAVDGIIANPAVGSGQFHVGDGTLVYLPGAAYGRASQPIFMLTEDGRSTTVRSAATQWSDPAVSPDGSKLAVTISDGSQSDIWIHDFTRDTMTRLTVDRGIDRAPVWSPDSRQIAFASDRAKPGGPVNIYIANADGSGSVTRLAESDKPQVPEAWHPTRNEILITEASQATLLDLVVLPYTVDPATGLMRAGEPRMFLQTPVYEGAASISPDGRWVAYASNPGGVLLPDVYVRPYIGTGGPWQMTTQSCVFPKWLARPAEIRCLSIRSGRIMAIPYSSGGDSFTADRPRVWSPITYRPANITIAPFTVHPDGKRVVIGTVSTDGQPIDKVVLFQNFTDYLAR